MKLNSKKTFQILLQYDFCNNKLAETETSVVKTYQLISSNEAETEIELGGLGERSHVALIFMIAKMFLV